MAFNGTIPEVVPYFAAIGHACPEHYNPADYISPCRSAKTPPDAAQARS